jgi:hypothetical protein
MPRPYHRSIPAKAGIHYEVKEVRGHAASRAADQSFLRAASPSSQANLLIPNEKGSAAGVGGCPPASGAHIAFRKLIPFLLPAGVSRARPFPIAAPRAEAPRPSASDILGPALRRDPPSAEARLPTRGPWVAFASPCAHALYVFLGVVAVAVSVAGSGLEVASPLPRSEPLDRNAQLAGRLRDRVGGAQVLSHAPTIDGAPERVYRNWLGKPIPVLGLKTQTSVILT